MRAKVVIIGHGYTSRLGIIRSLAEIGCEIIVIAMVYHGRFGRFIRFDGGKPVDCCSKYVDKFFFCSANSEKDLINILLTKCADPDQKTIIIPDSDFSAAVVDKYQEELKSRFLFPHINYTVGAVEKWMNKDKQKVLAKEIGIPVANGIIVHVSPEGFVIPPAVRYPCFTKPLATIKGGKRLLRRCDNEVELRTALSEMGHFFDADVLIEDFKQIDNEYAVLGVSDGHNVIIPAVIKFVVNSKSHFGIAREGVVMPIDGFENVIAAFQQLVRKIGFCGLFDIDFYDSGGILYFGELNLRYGGSGYAVTRVGANLPALFVSLLSGQTKELPFMSVTKSASFVNERMCIDDWSFYYLTSKEMKRIINASDIHFVYDDKDPGPQKKLGKYIALQRFKRVLRKVMH